MTITIAGPTLATFTRRLDVLPGDLNDDGVVNAQDGVDIRNEILGINGAVPTTFGDINGDGVVNNTDYNLVRARIGTALPTFIPTSSVILIKSSAVGGSPAVVRIAATEAAPVGNLRPRIAVRRAQPRAEIQLAARGNTRRLIASSTRKALFTTID